MDYYQILDVSRTANSDTIKKAYRKLALEHHPDKNESSEESSELFKKISVAYATLNDPDLKRKYDFKLCEKDDFKKQQEDKLRKQQEDKLRKQQEDKFKKQLEEDILKMQEEIKKKVQKKLLNDFLINQYRQKNVIDSNTIIYRKINNINKYNIK